MHADAQLGRAQLSIQARQWERAEELLGGALKAAEGGWMDGWVGGWLGLADGRGGGRVFAKGSEAPWGGDWPARCVQVGGRAGVGADDDDDVDGRSSTSTRPPHTPTPAPAPPPQACPLPIHPPLNINTGPASFPPLSLPSPLPPPLPPPNTHTTHAHARTHVLLAAAHGERSPVLCTPLLLLGWVYSRSGRVTLAEGLYREAAKMLKIQDPGKLQVLDQTTRGGGRLGSACSFV